MSAVPPVSVGRDYVFSSRNNKLVWRNLSGRQKSRGPRTEQCSSFKRA
jgi:hypothetical protein